MENMYFVSRVKIPRPRWESMLLSEVLPSGGDTYQLFFNSWDSAISYVRYSLRQYNESICMNFEEADVLCFMIGQFRINRETGLVKVYNNIDEYEATASGRRELPPRA